MTRDPGDGGISVIVYAYNHEPFLAECLDSLVTQTLSPSEIVVCDDHSTDGTWDIARRFAEEYPDQVRTFRHPRNMGMHHNANFGLRQARGAFVTSLGGDDRWLPAKLEREHAALAAFPDAGAAYSGVIVIDRTGKPTGERWEHADPAAHRTPQDLFVPVFAKQLFPRNTNVFRNALIRRRVLEAVGFYDEQILIHVDWDHKIRMAAVAPIVYTGERLVEYRVHPGGVHNSPKPVLCRSLIQVYEKNRPLLEERSPRDRAFVTLAVEGLIALMPGSGESAGRPAEYSAAAVLERWSALEASLSRESAATLRRELLTIRQRLLFRAGVDALRDGRLPHGLTLILRSLGSAVRTGNAREFVRQTIPRRLRGFLSRRLRPFRAIH